MLDLRVIWECSDLENARFSGDELHELGKATSESLINSGLIRQVENSTSVVCDACGEHHVEEVTYIESPPGSPLRTYIHCPNNGRIRVPLDRLKQWEVNFNGLASAISATLKLTETVQEIVPGRIWFLGKATLTGNPRELFLARGLKWSDASRMVKNTKRLHTSYAVVFVPGSVPSDEVWQTDNPRVIELDTVTSMKPQGLFIDVAFLEKIMQSLKTAGQPTMLTAAHKADYTKHKYLCYDSLHFPGTGQLKRSNDVVVNARTIKMPDAEFRLLIELVVELKKGEGGWLTKDIKVGGYQGFGHLRKTINGYLLEKDAKKFIENGGSKRYRISMHPDLVTYELGNLLKHTDAEVRELAKKLPPDGSIG